MQTKRKSILIIVKRIVHSRKSFPVFTTTISPPSTIKTATFTFPREDILEIEKLFDRNSFNFLPRDPIIIEFVPPFNKLLPQNQPSSNRISPRTETILEIHSPFISATSTSSLISLPFLFFSLFPAGRRFVSRILEWPVVRGIPSNARMRSLSLSLFLSLSHSLSLSLSLYSLSGRENKLKIAVERIAVGTFEAAARNPQQSLIVRIVFRRPDVDDDGERPSRYHYEGRSRSRLTRTANLALP